MGNSPNICTRQAAFIGPTNQKKLAEAVVAVVGLGALGSTSAHLLTRMGIGTLLLFDDDVVADHNLGRQHLYVQADIGEKKAVALKKRLQEIRPGLKIKSYDMRLTKDNASYLDDAILILDGTDNHITRRVIDAHAKQKGLSWVHAAAIENKGTVIHFPQDMKYDEVYVNKTKDQHCEISGVLATTTTMVASLQTHIALKLLIGEDVPRVMYRLDDCTWNQIQL